VNLGLAGRWRVHRKRTANRPIVDEHEAFAAATGDHDVTSGNRERCARFRSRYLGRDKSREWQLRHHGSVLQAAQQAIEIAAELGHLGSVGLVLAVIGGEAVREARCECGIDNLARHQLGEPGRRVVDLDLLEHEIAREVRRTAQRDGGGLEVVLGEGGAYLAELAAELFVTS